MRIQNINVNYAWLLLCVLVSSSSAMHKETSWYKDLYGNTYACRLLRRGMHLTNGEIEIYRNVLTQKLYHMQSITVHEDRYGLMSYPLAMVFRVKKREDSFYEYVDNQERVIEPPISADGELQLVVRDTGIYDSNNNAIHLPSHPGQRYYYLDAHGQRVDIPVVQNQVDTLVE